MKCTREEIALLRGPIPAVHTPLDHDGGSLRLEVVPGYLEHLRRTGAPAAYVCGSTGESLSLTVSERCRLLEAWVEAAGADLPIIAHVGSNALPDAIELAGHAAGMGVAAISAMNPTFGRARTVADLVDFHARIADAGDGTPYLVYEISAFGGVSFPAGEVVEASIKTVPAFAGMKFTSGDLLQLQLVLEIAEAEGLAIFFGSDEHLLAGLSLGCRAAIGSTYGYAPAPARAVFEAFERDDFTAARKAQRTIARLVLPLLRFGVLRTGKALLGKVGVPVGPPRSPECALQPRVLEAVLDEIAPLGIQGLEAGGEDC